ncbi:hypothetical protein GQ55_7G092400 [Panicum hallii var. hallii]|uniref:Uncharacterized protein n=1 Tax=Panicum hallii var. hallii TaxID=1504633 RepID=A0A2T7CTD2_9POAL|nr:hypothetical protein GQ55_7G092400 [Panicum hallii var. hallii]
MEALAVSAASRCCYCASRGVYLLRRQRRPLVRRAASWTMVPVPAGGRLPAAGAPGAPTAGDAAGAAAWALPAAGAGSPWFVLETSSSPCSVLLCGWRVHVGRTLWRH